MKLKKGWLKRQADYVEKDIATWPDWMKREAGLPLSNKGKNMKTYVGISRDHSGSMSQLAMRAMEDYNENIKALKEAAKSKNIETNVSTIKCDSQVKPEDFESVFTPVENVPELKRYQVGGGTPLFDSVGALIELLEKVPDANKDGVSFLIMVVTDGYENTSTKWSGSQIAERIKKLQATDKWTFTFRVPKGYNKVLENFGIPSANILQWEQTEEGVKQSTAVNKVSIGKFFEDKTKGIHASKDFYTTDLTGVSSKKIESKLVNISDKVKFWPVPKKNHGMQIREFCERRLKRSMIKGSAFYQLMKPEKAVQDYKIIAIRDKVKNEVYTGAHARQLLGLPYNGSVKIVPGNHGKYDIFVQSTSVNRKLVSGTQIMYWEQNQI